MNDFPVQKHELIDQRSLALAQVTAERLRSDHSSIQIAHMNIERWKETCSVGAGRSLDEWAEILKSPIDHIIGVLIGNDQRSVRLRQSSLYVGVLSISERNAIFRRFEPNNTTAT